MGEAESVIYLNFRKSFDTVLHSIFIGNQGKYGHSEIIMSGAQVVERLHSESSYQ